MLDYGNNFRRFSMKKRHFITSVALLCGFMLTLMSEANANYKAGKNRLKDNDQPALIKPALTGVWKSECGSSLTITSTPTNHMLTGAYITKCKKMRKCVNKPLPLIGLVNGNAASLMVDFSSCHPDLVMTMTGFIGSDQQLHAMHTWLSKSETKGKYYMTHSAVYKKSKK